MEWSGGSQAAALRSSDARRRSPWRARLARALALAGALAAAALPVPAEEDAAWAEDAVHVYYGQGDCRGDEIELEVWDREAGAWAPHPAHPRVSIPSCRVEDAGVLLNELRWRCVEPPDSDPPPVWVVGVDVFEPEVMSRCAVEAIDAGARRTAISVSSPGEGVPVRAPEPVVPVMGSVRVDGLEGSDYEVVLAIDRSAVASAEGPDPLAAQIEAARAFARRLAPRQRAGAVRIGVVSYPNLPPGPGESTAVRRELGLSADPREVEAALAGLPRRPVDSLSTLGSALSLALDEIAAGRPGARGVIVAGFDGHERFASSRLEAALERAAERAAERGVVLHLFALGGLAEGAPAAVERVLGRTRGSFTRLLPSALASDFLAAVELPVAEAVWIEALEGERVAAQLDHRGRFRAEVPVEPGANALRIHARTSDGAVTERRFELVFDDALILEQILEAERERIRRAQRKRLELDAGSEEAPL